jgi:hypothetical protein
MDDMMSAGKRRVSPLLSQARAVSWAVLALSSLLVAGPVSAQNTAARDVAGVWWTTSYSPKIQPVGGGELPFTPAGRAAYDKNVAGLRDGSIKDEARRLCVPDGIPRILGNPYPFQIIHTPGQTTIIYELNHVIRMVAMDKPQLSKDELEIYPWYSGHSVGRWDGDTLVVETAGYNEKSFVDATGAPHSDQMTTVEHIRKVSATQLENVVTVTDPVHYSRPWSARFVYNLHANVRLQDYVCGEPHRDINHIPGVREARQNLRPFTP